MNISLQNLEVIIDANSFKVRVSFNRYTTPKHLHFLCAKFGVGAMDRKAKRCSRIDEIAFPLARYSTLPAGYAIFKYRKVLVRDNEVFFYAHHLPKAFTLRTSSYRIVEAEHLWRRFLENSPIGFKDIAKLL